MKIFEKEIYYKYYILYYKYYLYLIEKKYLIPHATGKICGKTTRDYVTLSRDTVPTIFAHLSRYYTSNIPMKRKSHEEQEQKKINAKKKKSLCGILIYQDVCGRNSMVISKFLTF